MINYTDLQTRVKKVLWDEAGALFTDNYLQDGMKQALDHYSKLRPLQQITTIVAVDSREQSVSAVSGILDVVEVWCPYNASNPEDPPLIRGFDYWPDQKTIYLKYPYRPVAGDVLRVFYQKLHTIEGLDSETTTTIPLDDESAFCHGSAGYVVQSRARATSEQVVLQEQVPVSKTLMDWSMRKIAEMEYAIKLTKERESGLLFVDLPRLDIRDKQFS